MLITLTITAPDIFNALFIVAPRHARTLSWTHNLRKRVNPAAHSNSSMECGALAPLSPRSVVFRNVALPRVNVAAADFRGAFIRKGTAHASAHTATSD